MIKVGSEVLWLSEEDVASLLSMDEAVVAVEGAFRLQGQGKAQMPTKIYLEFVPFGGDLRAMPAYLREPVTAAGVKIVNSNANNPAKGLPAVAGIMAYVDPQTGLPLGLFGAGNMTAIRTGAAGGIAAKYLARKNSKVVGLVGCGRQAATQLEALTHFFKIERALVWGKTRPEIDTFCRLSAGLNIPFVPCSDPKAACDADIIVTTTPVKKPIVKASWVKPGTHINAIGADAPGKQELETALLSKARVVVDEWHQASHAGEINVPFTKKKFTKAKLAAELGQVVTGKRKGRTSDRDITIFDSTGLAIQDVAVAKVIFEKAVKLNKGQVLKLHG